MRRHEELHSEEIPLAHRPVGAQRRRRDEALVWKRAPNNATKGRT